MEDLGKYIKPYFKKKGKDIGYKKSSPVHVIFDCPFCGARAHTLPNQDRIQCLATDKYLDFLDIVKEVEDLETDNEVIEFLNDFLDADLVSEKKENQIDEAFNFYERQGFSLTPVHYNKPKKKKVPVEREWTQKEHRDKAEWYEWLDSNLNLGILTGKMSGITVIDIDIVGKEDKKNKEAIENKEIPHKIKKVLNKTLVQETAGGFHLFYQYEDFPKTEFDVEGIHVDIENDGGYVLSFPSKIKGRPFDRKFYKLREPAEMSDNLKEFLNKNVGSREKKTYSEEVIEDVERSNYKKSLISEGQGRNELFIRLGGKLQKFLDPDDVKKSLRTLDNTICDPVLGRELDRTVFRSLEKYFEYNKDELKHEIIDYLRDVDEASQAEMEFAIFGKRSKNELKKRMDKILSKLVKNRTLVRRNKTYKLLKSMEWKDTFMEEGKRVNFKVPYFHDRCYFNQGDLIVIGARPEVGKTTLAMNVVRRIANQGIKPYYVYNETGGRWKGKALSVGLKEGDFYRDWCSDPTELILEENAVTVYDWVKPPDFARTDNLYDEFAEQLDRVKGVLICFAQLKDDGSFYAESQMMQFPTLVTKYEYEDDYGEETKFNIIKNRDAKRRRSAREIPCVYDWDTDLVLTREEYELKKEKENE